MSNKRILKAYERYDGNGKVVPGSNILNRFKPAVGNWKEMDGYLCCNDITTTTSSTTTLPPCYLFEMNVIAVASVSGIDCDGVAISLEPKSGVFNICARSLEGVGEIIITNLGPCNL